MKKSMRKLSLNRETIGRLDPGRMEQAAGGQTLTCLKGTTCCPPPTNAGCESMSHCAGSVCCTQEYAGCGSALSQCITVCLPCNTGTACVG